jgi:hypothetical protein
MNAKRKLVSAPAGRGRRVPRGTEWARATKSPRGLGIFVQKAIGQHVPANPVLGEALALRPAYVMRVGTTSRSSSKHLWRRGCTWVYAPWSL